MKSLFIGLLGLGIGLLTTLESAAQTTTQTFNSNGTFTVPAGVTVITVEAWGAGGAGGGNANNQDGGGGGGGGGYSRSVLTGVSGSYAVVRGTGGTGSLLAGTSGTASTFGTTLVTAAGGTGGNAQSGTSPGTGGQGGQASAGTGDVKYSGGSGGDGRNNNTGRGGGGGSSAGSASDGSNGSSGNSNPPSGGTAPTDGGNGGAGGTGTSNGTAGTTPGGGGGGSAETASGGGGANGRVVVSYTLPDVSNFNVALVNGCTGSGVSFSVTSSSLTSDTYTITYNITGTANSVSSTTSAMVFSGGTGTFTVANLATAENDVLNVTRITSSSGNYRTLTSTTNFTLVDCQVWYSYESGNFNNPDVWTLDPSGTTYDNGLLQTPQNGEEIVILNGFTVTTNFSTRNLVSTTIEAGGILDMLTATGWDLGTITGGGLLRVKGTNLPSGTFTDFVSTLGGTIEYYDIGGDLPVGQAEYNNLRVTNSLGSITYVLISNLTVHGTFEIATDADSGTTTWQINDNSNTQRSITLNGDLAVASGGRITVGTGNESSSTQHALSMHGNITNNGIIKFYDPTDSELIEADYGKTYSPAGIDLHRNELQGNAVTVTFMGTTNKTISCNNTTDFYRFVVNKGTGQQAILTVNSTGTANFRLFGPADLGSNSGSTNNEYSDNALSLINGTLELTGSINIPVVSVRSSDAVNFFSIPQESSLWLNSPNVTVNLADNDPSNDDQRLMLNGTLRVSSGTLNGGDSKGIGSQDGGAFILDGGTINCWMFRPRAVGPGVFSFQQTGGTFNIGYGFPLGGGVDYSGYYRFDLPSPNSTFIMSGGTLNIAKPSANGLFRVLSTAGNYTVTGGTVNLNTGVTAGTTSYAGLVNLTVPVYNLNIYEESATSTSAELISNNLNVLNNLSVNTGNNPNFILNSLNLTVGGNFTLNSGTTFTPGTGVITFDGSGAQTWTHNGSITSLASVVVAKASGTLTLAGSGTFPDITAALTLTSGTLADGGKTISVTGTGILTNSATHSGTGLINYASTTAAIEGSDGTFGNLTIATNATIATVGKQTITGNLRLTNTNSTLNIGSNELVVNGNIYSDGTTGVAFTATKRIRISGLHNAGGLTRKGASGDLLFPVGVQTTTPTDLYTPATINVTAAAHGSITVRPVNSAHPVVTTASQSVQYYWRVTSTGYTGITAVTHKSYNFSTATKSGTLTTYRPARYDVNSFSWATRNTTYNATATNIIPDFNTGTSWTGVSGDQLDGEYTVGNVAAFGTVKVFYSRQTGNWNESTTWSNASHTGAAVSPSGNTIAGTHFPGVNNPVAIGDGISNNHAVATVANSSCGTLAINAGSSLDCSTFTGHNFGTSTGGSVSGRGTLRINSSVFPAGDFTDFLGSNGGTVEWYGTAKTIPLTGAAPQLLSLNKYYNLVINPSASNTITLPASNLTIYNSLVQGNAAGYTGTALTNGSRTISIAGDLTISRGTFNFSNSNLSVTTLTVTGNTTVSSGATMAAVGGGTANVNTLSTTGGIINNGSINFNNNQQLNLTFSGTNNVSFSGSGTTTLSLVTVNKGTSTAPSVTFNTIGALNTTAVAGGWLTITNGTFDWATNNTTSLSTNAYTINPTAKLKVSAGTLNTTSGDNDGFDLFLNGTLEVAGGTVNVGNTTVNTNNVDIEYGSAGVPAINISSGTMWVKGSIRRSASTITGALSYTQTSGTVTVAGISSSDVSDRGVFEMDANNGSNFTFTGSSVLNVQRQTGGTSFADVYINPKTSNVSSTSTLMVGLSSVVNNNLRINISPSVGNLTIAGTSAQTVNMFSNSLIVGGNLTIPSGSTLNTNSLNVTLSGNLVCPGTYTGGTNNTTFNGTGAQSGQLSASSTFNDVTIAKTAGTTLTLSGTSPILQNLYLNSGILDVGSLALDIRKNITNSSAQIGSGSILIYSTTGVSNTITASGGSFTNLTLGGDASGKSVTVDGNLTINGVLAFSAANRYLMIKSNRLTFGTNATITGAGSTAFIRTNGVTSDLGVTKNWTTGVNKSFTYHIGSSTNYTPAAYTFTNVTTAGSLNVIPVNSVHLTYDQNSTQRVLRYNWIVTRDASLAFAILGSHTYAYPSSLISGTGGTLVAGFLNPEGSPLGWQTSAHGGSATTTLMTYSNLLTTNLPAAGKTFDYSVGTTGTLPNPIAPLYSRLAVANVANLAVGGSWSTAANWTTDPTGYGAASAIVPTGVPAVILSGARINTISRGRKAYTTKIDGLLNIGTIAGHNLGLISGTGTMRIATNTFPAGDYTAFVEQDGGTIEYAGTMTMNNRSTYNNLTILAGSAAIVTMTATDLTINGNVNIPEGTTLRNSTNNADMVITGNLNNSGTFNAGNGQISIKGNWNNSGTVTSGTGAAKVTFNGTGAQNVTGTNAFNSLTINNGNTVTLGGTTTLTGVLTLTSGKIISNNYGTTPYLQLSASSTLSGGSASSFVSGQIRKTMNSASTFTFPTGSNSASRYRPVIITATSATDFWDVSYIPSNPTADMYNIASFNTANMKVVSQFEYWQIANGTGTTTAGLTLSFGSGSYGGSDLGVLSTTKIARWNGSQWDLPPGGGTFSHTGDNTAGTVSLSFQNAFSPHTIAGEETNSSLPVTWLSFTGNRVAESVQLEWKTATEINNDYFIVERSIDGAGFEIIGTRKGAGNSTEVITYNYQDVEARIDVLYYYRITQVDFDGQFEASKIVVVLPGKSPLSRWQVAPNPVSQGTALRLTHSGSSAGSGVQYLKLVTLTGVVVLDTSGNLSELNQTLNKYLDQCVVGVLLMQVSDGANTEIFRIIKN